MSHSDSQRLLETGVAYHQAGRLDEAANCYRRIPEDDPGWPHARHYLGLLAFQSGDFATAARLIGEAISLLPSIPEFHVNLGNALKRGGELLDAVLAYRRAIALRPGFAAAHANLGLALFDAGSDEEASTALADALRLDPMLHSCQLPLARVLVRRGRFDEAARWFDLALPRERAAAAWLEAAKSALAARRIDHALRYLEAALEWEPENYDVLNARGVALASLGRLGEARDCFRKARQLAPDRLEAVENLAITLKDAGQVDESLEVFRSALKKNPDSLDLRSNYVFSMMYSDQVTADELATAHVDWGRACGRVSAAAPALATFVAPVRDHARLRVGYVSADWWQHPVADFMQGVLRHHDRDRIDLRVYHVGVHQDAMTQRLRRDVANWNDLPALDARALADRLRADCNDVLVDLSGHTAENRLAAFAMRAAPLQITYLGYQHATGVPAIDYRIGDGFTDPTELPRSEALLRLPRCYYAYSPPGDAPAVTPLPLLKKRHLCFGVASNLAKVSPTTLDDWAILLRAFPDATLRWRANAFVDATVRTGFAEALRIRLSEATTTRLQLEPWVPSQNRWAAWATVDVALDTRPYNQATNICEALWMGVPTLSIAGASHVSRQGGSILHAAGLGFCVGGGPDDWITLAQRWMDAPHELAALRKDMRATLRASALFDSASLARALEESYERALGN